MTQLQAIRWFITQITNDHVTFRKRRWVWACAINENHPTFYLPSDLNENDEEDKLFRQDFISRCPLAHDFADISLTILHEVGHFYNREIALENDFEEYESITGVDHFKIPSEIVATDWAIQWLQNPENRKLAKAFERQYFKH